MTISEIQIVGTNQKISLGKELGDGREGTAFELQGSGRYAVKVFENIDEEKLEALRNILLFPTSPGYAFCNPQALAADVDTGETVGYVMSRVENGLTTDLVSLGTKNWLPRRFSIRVARNLVASMIDLHAAGLFRADWGKNILVTPDAEVHHIDCDGMAVAEFPARVGKPDWFPREVLEETNSGALFVDVPFGRDQDIHGLFVELHYLLHGDHPHQCRYIGPGAGRSRVDCVLEGKFPYAQNNPDPNFVRPGNAKSYGKLEDSIRDLFFQCFIDGNQVPSERPKLGRVLRILESLDKADSVALSNDHWNHVRAGTKPKITIPSMPKAPEISLSMPRLGETRIPRLPIPTSGRKTAAAAVVSGVLLAVLPLDFASLPFGGSSDRPPVSQSQVWGSRSSRVRRQSTPAPPKQDPVEVARERHSIIPTRQPARRGVDTPVWWQELQSEIEGNS